MTGIDILLIVTGAILVIASFMISEKISEQKNEAANGREIWSGRDEVTIKDRISIILADKTEQAVNDTNDRLCHLSNEKIMEFQEFSEQINEKLNENHNQSVFLYKMLTEKQGEMKEWIAEIDSKYAGIKDECNAIEEMLKKFKQTNVKEGADDKRAAQVKNVRRENAAGRDRVAPHTAVEAVNTDVKSGKRDANPVLKSVNKKTGNKPQAPASNKNERILELFDSGKSLIEVSKQLGIGQGEVKLVLDLYRGNKK